jgi:EmrB/QacA subfamily drug resistance transporter
LRLTKEQASQNRQLIVETASPAKRTTHPNLILAICCTSLLIVGMDVTVVNVALPAIQRDLDAHLSGLQWILDAYTLVVASFLILAGSMSDRFGRRRVFLIGLGVFTLGSLLCSQSATIEQLVGFRVLQGLGASMLSPVALSIIANAFPDPNARARAVGIWGAVAGVSLGIGPLIGGALTETIGWRSIFWINMPIGIIAALLAARFVPESKAARARAFDPVGQALVLIGLATLTWGVIEGPHAGWGSRLILGLFVTAAVALLAFVLYEQQRNNPLLDLRFFHSVPFSSATVLAVSAVFCFAGFLFLNTLYLQQVRRLSAFDTGLFTLPLALAMIICSTWSGRLVGVHGPKPSLLVAGVGFLTSTLILTGLKSRNIRDLAGGGIRTVRCGAGHGESRNREQRSSRNATVASGCRSGDFIDQQAGGRNSGGGGIGNRGGGEPCAWHGFHHGDACNLVGDDGVRCGSVGAGLCVEHGLGAIKHLFPVSTNKTEWLD